MLSSMNIATFRMILAAIGAGLLGAAQYLPPQYAFWCQIAGSVLAARAVPTETLHRFAGRGDRMISVLVTCAGLAPLLTCLQSCSAGTALAPPAPTPVDRDCGLMFGVFVAEKDLAEAGKLRLSCEEMVAIARRAGPLCDVDLVCPGADAAAE